jgi:hypothetical protein
VPTFTWGFLRSNTPLAMVKPPGFSLFGKVVEAVPDH